MRRHEDDHDLCGTVLESRAPQLVRGGAGLAVGIIKGGESRFHAFSGTVGSTTAVSARTLYEIGSLTKVFTTTLLAVLVRERVVTLDQPVRELLPEVPTLPLSITLEALATHTSGLPRLPENIWQSVRRNRHNPYAHYTEHDLLDYLRSVTTSDIEQTSGLVRYSNLGMGVLGLALSRSLGTSYEESIRTWICRPLGLDDTSISLTPEQQERLARPLSGTGAPASPFDMPALAGAGALHSTVDDQLRWLQAHLAPDDSFRQVVQLTLEVRHTTFASERGVLGMAARLRHLVPVRSKPAAKPVGVGLGWFRVRLPRSAAEGWMHNGATGGYRSFAAFVPASQTAVVVLTNQGRRRSELIWPHYTVDHLGTELLDTLNM